MELKNLNLYEMKEVISIVSKYGSNGFKIKLMINEDLISGRIEKLEKLREFSDKFKEFQSKYQEMAINHAEMDENTKQPVLYSLEGGKGDVRTDGAGIPNIVKNIDEYNKNKAELEVEYKHFIDEAEENNKEFNKTIYQVVDPEIDFVKIKSDDLPEVDDVNWYSYIKVLKPIIEL